MQWSVFNKLTVSGAENLGKGSRKKQEEEEGRKVVRGIEKATVWLVTMGCTSLEKFLKKTIEHEKYNITFTE